MTLEKVLSNLIYSDSYTGRFSTGENSLASYPFPDDGKELIREYVTYLYNESSIAREILEELDKPLNVYSSDELLVTREGGEPSLFIDKKLFDGTFSKAYISETGTVVEYDSRLALMHEFIHVIRNLDDKVNYNSQEGSAGDTQNLANTIHEELGVPKRISYDATFTPNNKELTPTTVSYKPGTEYTEGNEIDIARVTGFTFDKTLENNPPTRDLVILTGANGKVVSTGGGNDYIYGSSFGNDTLNGGGDNDYLDGKEVHDGRDDADVAVYKGSADGYNIEFLNDGEVKITDTVVGRDGSDRLFNMEFGQFTDKRVPLEPGLDIAFVIDTTGSMGGSINAVQSSANQIINSIFDSALNSRIAVVGYNDPGTNTFLSFTNQPSIEDRKSAAQSAINSVSASGGGDFPEAVNAGLIRALNGSAGEWRSDASARRIILFGDAPPNDTALRSQVLSLAANVGVSTPTSPSTFASASAFSFAPLSIAGDIETSRVSEGLAMTTFAIETFDTEGSTITVPVEIFTVLIGNNYATRTDFESLATATGGQAFTAANASEVVDTLIEAIKTPTVVNNAPVAIEDTFVTDEDISLTLDVLINDSDLDGDILTISEVNGVTAEVGTEFTLESGASLTLNSDGTLSYNPGFAFAELNGGETSSDRFLYGCDVPREYCMSLG